MLGHESAIPHDVAPAPRRRRWRSLLLLLIGLAVVGAAGYGGFLLADSRDGEQTEATGSADDTATSEAATDDAQDVDDAADAEDTATATDNETAAGGSEGAEESSEDATVTVQVEDASESGDEAGAASEGESTASGDAPLNDGNRQAFFRGGKVYLTGAVPSEEIAELIVTRAAAVVGPDNVVNEYTIDPSVTINPGDSAPLYVEDVVLFEFNSIEVAEPFLPILDLGTLLLRQNPQASVTVVTRTDAVGSEEVNLEVARQRAQAVIDYWLAQGVDPDQVIADPRGEEGASDGDDAETAATQRRAEFIITGLLD